MYQLISFIIPSLGKNPKRIEKRVKEITQNVLYPHEIIVVDGSKDGLVKPIAEKHHLVYTRSTNPGRGQAMDDGAKQAKGSILVFLHEDTRLPKNVAPEIIASIEQGFIGGACKKRFNKKHWYLSYLTWLNHIRSKVRKIFFGDQLIFVLRNTFATFGGFNGDPLFEDVNISKHMKKHGNVAYLDNVEVITDASRISSNKLRYALTTLQLKILYALGISEEKLFAIYYKNKTS